MKRKTNVIDLGVATKETKGLQGVIPDEQNGLGQPGIAKD